METAYKKAFKIPFILILLIIVLILGIIIAGFSYYKTYEKEYSGRFENQLSAVTDRKVNEITQWRKERLGDATDVPGSRFLSEAIEKWISNKYDADLKKKIAERLTLTKDNYGYEDILIVSPDGKLRLSLDPQNTPIDSITEEHVRLALDRNSPFLSDFYYSKINDRIFIDVLNTVRNDKNIPFAIMILRIDPGKYLYPYLQDTTQFSRSAETVIVRKDGDSVLFLNEMRYIKDAALKHRISLTQKATASVQAVSGYEGIFKGKDYRNAKILADIRPIPGTSWFLIEKVDNSEISTVLYYRGGMVIGFSLLLIICIGLGVAWVFSIRQKNIYEKLFHAEKNLLEKEEEFKITLYSIGDAVITTGTDGCIKNMNHVAEELTGWLEKDAVGKQLATVFKILNEETREMVESPVEKVLREGAVVGLANHTVLISKNGKEIPIADSGAPIRFEKEITSGIVLVFRDQTGERKMQRELRDSEGKFRETVKHLDEAYYSVTTDGLLIDHNQAYNRILGIDIKMDLIGQKTPDLWQNPEDRKLYLNELMSKGFIRSYLANAKKINDEKIVVLMNSHLVKDENGLPVRIEGTFSDFTERRRAEEELRASEERYRSAFDNMLEGCQIVDFNWRYIYVNDSFVKHSKYSRKELMSHTVLELYPGIENTGIFKIYQQCFNERIPIHLENKFTFPDNSVGWFDLSYQPVPEGIFILSIDITESKRAEEALRLSQEKYRDLFQNAEVGMYRSKLDGTGILAVNRKLCGIFGYTEQEMLDNPATIRWADPDARNKMVKNIQKTGFLHDYEMDILTKSKEIRNLSISVSLYPEQGYLEGSAIDITERKRSEIALRASEKRFRIAAGSLIDVVYEWDLNDKVDWYGDIDGIMGYPAGGFPRTLAGWAAKLHPEDTNKVMAAIEAHLKRSEPYISEYRVMNKEGEWRWWNARGTALRDEQNIPYWWIGSITDITERKLAEEVIKNNEKRIRELIESLPQLFWTCRVDGPCDYLSKQWVEYTGIPEEAQLGYRWLEQLHPEDRDRTVTDWMEKVKTGNSFDIEFRIRRNDDVYHWFKTRAVPMRDAEGNIIKWFGSNTDIDDLKKADEQLHKLNRIYLLLSDINQAIVRIRTPRDLFDKVCKITVEQGGFGMAWIGLIDQSSQKLQVIAQAGRSQGYLEQVDIALNGEPISYCPIDSAIRQGNHFTCKIAENEEMSPCQKIAYELGFRSSASFPLKVFEILRGAITFYSDETEFFDEEELKLLDELALDISFAMEYAEKEDERKQSEEALRESQEKYYYLYENSPVGMYHTKIDGSGIIEINNSACEMLGFKKEELIGQPSAIRWADSNRRSEILKIMSKYGVARNFDADVLKKDGTNLSCLLSMKIFKEKGFIEGFILDITERKRAEEQLQFSNQRLTQHIQQTPIAFIEFDIKGTVQGWNPAAVDIFGYSKEEAIGQHWTFIVPEEIQGSLEGVWEALVLQKGGSRSINENTTKDGRKIISEWHSTPLADPEGKTFGVGSLIMDITDRKLAEEEIRRLNTELEDRVVIRTAQLEASNKELEAFTYSVSHDLRAPLRHTSGYVELLSKKFQSVLTEKGQHYLNSISDSVRQMGALIDDLLQFSRAGRLEMRQSDVDMNKIAGEIVDQMRLDNPKRNIEWIIDPLPSVHGDYAMLQLVWTNLMSNAVKFTRTRKKVKIEIRTIDEINEIIFFIRDNGVGFDMQYAGKLFGVFQRLHPTEQFEGTGIGLANVQRIVLRHGGRVWAESEIDKGATFYFSLPK